MIVRELRIVFKVGELSGNFDFGEGNLQFIKGNFCHSQILLDDNILISLPTDTL